MAEEETAKRRVNLYLDVDLVDKAQKLGYNLSQITNEMLESIPEPKETDTNKAYLELFAKMQPAIDHHNVQVEIGFGTDDNLIYGVLYLVRNGNYIFKSDLEGWTPDLADEDYQDNMDENLFIIRDVFKFMKNNEQFELEEPRMIFSNLLKEIAKRKKKDKETIMEIEKFKRIISAIEPDLLEEKK